MLVFADWEMKTVSNNPLDSRMTVLEKNWCVKMFVKVIQYMMQN